MYNRPPWGEKYQSLHVGWYPRHNHPCQIWCRLVQGFSIPEGLNIGVFHWQGSSPLQQFYTTVQTVIEPELLPIGVLHCGNRDFRVFWQKIVEVIKKFYSHPANDVAVTETHFLTHYRLFYLVCYTHSKCCLTPNRWTWSLPFRSRDKNGGHTIRSAISKNPMLYANFTTLSFIEPELLPIEVLHCGNREFRVFLRKIV